MRITKPFYMGQCDVTVGQFKKFIAETGYTTEAEWTGPVRNDEERADRACFGTGGWGYNAQTGMCEDRDPKYNWRNTGFPQTDDHPVVNVTWNDAVAFCQWLSRKERKDVPLAHQCNGNMPAGPGPIRDTPTATIPSNSPTSPTFRTTLAARSFRTCRKYSCRRTAI